MKLLILLMGFVLSANLQASSWQNNFFTDDSAYYLKLNQTGFEQRFRVTSDKCDSIESAEVILKSNPWDHQFKFKRLGNSELKKWPALYKESVRGFCWFAVKVSGINLNDSPSNLYSIKIKDKYTQKIWYFEEMGDSILPANRFTEGPIKNWMSLGTLGATPVQGGGVFFKIWEPEVDEVHLFLENNSDPLVLTPDQKGIRRSHSMYVSWAKEGTKYHYKFQKNGSYILQEVANDERMSDIKVDPMARSLTYDAKGGKQNGYINPKAIVRGLTPYSYRHDDKISSLSPADRDNWLIYQIWPLTFNPKKKNGKYVQGTFNDIAERIPYLSELGITSVEFLPIHESRFHASWGYAMDSLYLLENTYGSPSDLKKLVDQFHEKKIRVVLDVVLNHLNNQLIRDPLSKTLHESKYYKGNTGWGPKPRFESVMVRKWIVDSLLALVREYHVDGFRFDMVEHIYLDNPAGYKFLQELNILLKQVNPDFYTSAEQLPDNAWATYPIKDGGLGFDSQWNDKFKNFFELEFDHYRQYNRNLDTSPLIGSLQGYSNHSHDNGEYHFGHANRSLNYLGSHDVVGNKNPILRMVSRYESYEWEGGNHFFRVRPLSDPDNKESKFRQIHNPFTHSVGRIGYGILFTKPGGALFFQGEEMANDINIENEWSYINAKEGNTIPTQDVDVHRYVSSHRVPWEYLTPETSAELHFLNSNEKRMFKGYHGYFKQMLQLKKKFPEINFEDAKNVQSLDGGNIIAYEIGRGGNEFFVVINFGEDKTSQWIQFPGRANSWWEEITNSSSFEFGGESDKFLNIISNLGGRANHLRLKSTSIAVFKRNVDAGIARALYLRGTLNSWAASEDYKLNMASDRGDIYVVNFDVEKEGKYEFKLGTADWAIDMGISTSLFLDPFPLNDSNEFFDENKGFLSYSPGLPNIATHFEKGHYKFIFNIRTFKYSFIKIN